MLLSLVQWQSVGSIPTACYAYAACDLARICRVSDASFIYVAKSVAVTSVVHTFELAVDDRVCLFVYTPQRFFTWLCRDEGYSFVSCVGHQLVDFHISNCCI